MASDSISKKVIFCFCCKLFFNSKTKLGTESYNDWKHVTNALKEHDTSITSYLVRITFKINSKKKLYMPPTNV